MQNNAPQGQLRTAPGFTKATMPDFPAWVTNQMTHDHQHHNLQSPYLANDSKPGTANPRTSNGGIGNLASGDVCDSNAFLNYVLSQQRSNGGGIFVFDSRLNADVNACQNCDQKLTPAPKNQYAAANTKARNPPDGIVPTHRDASTNTTLQFPPDFNEACLKDYHDSSDVARQLYSQLGLPQKPPTKHLVDNDADDCAPTDEAKSCKCVQDCDAHCVKDNRRVHFLDIDRPFTCEICLKNYPSEGSLLNHVRYHKGTKPYQCETCNKAFATNSHLTTHKRTHSGEKPFECSHCYKSFSDRSSFTKHGRTHGPNGSTVKKHKCPMCGNGFVDSCGLKKHIRIHTGERPYRCAVCSKAFATSSTFVAHKRIHSGERPHGCPHCAKRFVTKSHLLTHGRVHSGEKPFACRACGRTFSDGSSCRRHERLHGAGGREGPACDV